MGVISEAKADPVGRRQIFCQPLSGLFGSLRGNALHSVLRRKRAVSDPLVRFRPFSSQDGGAGGSSPLSNLKKYEMVVMLLRIYLYIKPTGDRGPKSAILVCWSIADPPYSGF